MTLWGIMAIIKGIYYTDSCYLTNGILSVFPEFFFFLLSEKGNRILHLQKVKMVHGPGRHAESTYKKRKMLQRLGPVTIHSTNLALQPVRMITASSLCPNF